MSDVPDLLRRARSIPDQLAAGRVVRRAERTLDEGRRRRPVVGIAVALAAGTLLGALAVERGPAGGAPAPAEAGEALAASAPATRRVGDDVALTFAGSGALAGDDRSPRIRWDAGELRVEVRPGQGIDLVVETPEGTASVLGTGFSVTRDALGTTVEVAHGRVAVHCHDGREARLGADESMVCLPVRGSGMLARARALEAAGADAQDALDALEAGLRLEPQGGAIRSELAARRIRVLADLGRVDEAGAAAEAWLAGPDTLRRDEVRNLAVSLALGRGDCARALGASDDDAGLFADTSIALAECAAVDDPGRARRLLERARDVDPARADDVARRLRQIP